MERRSPSYAQFFTVQNDWLANTETRLWTESETPPPLVWAGHELDADYYDKLDLANTSQVKPIYNQLALDLHKQLEGKRDRAMRHREHRLEVARTFERTAEWAERDGLPLEARRFRDYAKRLETARMHGLWGVDVLEHKVVEDWRDRADLSKYCPDDARREGQRLTARYLDRLEDFIAAGYEVRYAVFTFKNAPQWHLAAAMDAMIQGFKQRILYARTDGRQARRIEDKKRVFPELVGALGTLECPLSGRYEAERHNWWHVHLNAMMVFRGRPDYKALREAWGANVEFKTVPRGAARAALSELLKYPTRAISYKSAEDRKPKRDRRTGELLPPAPPFCEWPCEAVFEWDRAHRRTHRTRSWGELHANKCTIRDEDGNKLEPERRLPWQVEWIGKLTNDDDGYRVDFPMPDTREIDARQGGARLESILGIFFARSKSEFSTGPPQQVKDAVKRRQRLRKFHS